jgi:hypothetical protein
MEVLSRRDLTVGGYPRLLLSLFLSAGYTAPMPKPNSNGQSKPKKVPRLTANDLCALRDFVNKRLAEPPAPQNPSTPSLSDLIEQSPDVYRFVVDLLSQGHSIQAASAATGVSLPIVKAASWFVPDYRQICKNATARNLALANLRMSEILVERTDSLPVDRVPFALAVSVEKAELLGGGITQRTETRQVVTREELQRLFDQLHRAKVRELPNSDSARKS